MKKKLLLALLSGTLMAQAQFINGDMNHNNKLDVADVTMLLNGYLTETPQVVEVDVNHYAVRNELIAGKWMKSATESITFNVDGTTDYAEGYTYKFLPSQGYVLFSNAAGIPVSVLKIVFVTQDYLVVKPSAGNDVVVYAAVPTEPDKPTEPETPELKDSTEYGLEFQKEFGTVNEGQDWSMTELYTLAVSIPEASTVTIYGTFVTSEFGARKLAEFTGVQGTQLLSFIKPMGLKELYAIVSNPTFNMGKSLTGTGSSWTFPSTGNSSFDLASCVSQMTKDVPVDRYALNTLPDGSNNTGKVTQSSRYISDGKPITITPVYSDCGFNNTLGIYVEKGDGQLEKLDLWTKYDNHTSGTMSRPVFTVTLPAGVVFGFYIVADRNVDNTYFTDAALNAGELRSAGVFQGEECTYLAFEDMPQNGDMDYNDMVFSVSPALPVLDNDASEWIVAAELDDEDCDYDFNDVVMKVSYVAGSGSITITPMAAGTTKSVEVYRNGVRMGEVHQLFLSLKPVCINTIADGLIYTAPVTSRSIAVPISLNYSVVDLMKELTFKVDGKEFSAAQIGFSPRVLLIANGQWRWPTEGTSIGKAYPEFGKWVENPGELDWMLK